MKLLPLNKLGAQELRPKVIQFGVFLPGVNPSEGYDVSIFRGDAAPAAKRCCAPC